MVAYNKICKHKRHIKNELPYCYNTTDVVHERSSCASFCTNEASCVGFAFRPRFCKYFNCPDDFVQCYLYQTDDSACPSDWGFHLGDDVSTLRANDLDDGTFVKHGWSCYAKNAGKILLQFEQYICALFSCQYNLLMTKRLFYFYRTLIKSTVNGDLGLNGLLAQKHAEEERNLAQGK